MRWQIPNENNFVSVHAKKNRSVDMFLVVNICLFLLFVSEYTNHFFYVWIFEFLRDPNAYMYVNGNRLSVALWYIDASMNRYTPIKATISHIVIWVHFKMNCHQNMKLHHSFIYLYQTRIFIANMSLKIQVLILLSSYIFKALL